MGGMSYASFLLGLALQAPPAAPAAADFDQALEPERRFAERLSEAMGKDLQREWAKYVDDERGRAQARAEGSDDADDAEETFGDYLDAKYRRRRNVGIILFGVGFGPLAVGLYTGLTLGEASDIAIGIAGLGGALIVSGAVVWAVRGVQLRKLRRARARLEAGRQAHLQWRGIAPLVHPQTGTHGLSLGFAF